MYFFLFFFNDTATTEIYTLSLHDALPLVSRDGLDASTPSPPHRSSQPSRVLGRRRDLSDRSGGGRRAAGGGGAASARQMGGSDGHPARAPGRRERDGRGRRGARRHRGPEPGLPLDRARLAPPEALGGRLRHVGRADGGRATLRPAAPPRPILRRVRDVGPP